MGRQQLMMYPPKGTWICPGCGHKHTKPHYSLPGQIDYTKKPGDPGRILFNRRDKNDYLATDTPIKNDMPSHGDAFDEEGYQKPLYCSHCGYEDDFIVILRIGDLPDLIDRFFAETKFKRIPKTWRSILSRFLDWYRRRQEG